MEGARGEGDAAIRSDEQNAAIRSDTRNAREEDAFSAGGASAGVSSVLAYLRESRTAGNVHLGDVGNTSSGEAGMKFVDTSFEDSLFSIPGGEGASSDTLPGSSTSGKSPKLRSSKTRGNAGKSPKQAAEEEEAGKRRLASAVAASKYCAYFFTAVPVGFYAMDRSFYASTHRLLSEYRLDIVGPLSGVAGAIGFMMWATKRCFAFDGFREA